MTVNPGRAAAASGGWVDGRMAAFDLATTGLDTGRDRIVAAALALVGGGLATEKRTWLVNPGVDIPEQSTAVHGITTQQAREDGLPAAEAVEELTTALAAVLAERVPVVVFTARFGLTVLDREARRLGIVPLAERLPRGELVPVIDPMVLDKGLDRYRRGSRRLPDLCAHYQVRYDGQRSPVGDALAAARLAWRLGTVHPRIGGLDARAVHLLQIGWAADQAASLQAHLRRTDPAAVIDGSWPMVPLVAEGGESS